MPHTEPAPTFIETARRAQILRGAIETVNEVGYHRASLAEISRRAGVAKSAIVYYFGTRDALMASVIEHVFGRLGAATESAVSRERGPVQRLRAYAESTLAHIGEHRTEMAAGVAIAVSHRAADGEPAYLEQSEEDTALLRGILSAGMREGVFRELPVAAGVAIVEALLDAAVTAVQRDPGADPAPLNEQILLVLLRGLEAPR